jgi:hypothetical protein
MNSYATTSQLSEMLGGGDADALLLAVESASREVESPGMANRVFYTRVESRWFDVESSTRPVWIDDLIAVDSVEIDGQEVDLDDLEFLPRNQTPFYQLTVMPQAHITIPCGQRVVKIDGTWGYGDGYGNVKRRDGVTATVADSSTTAVTLSGTPKCVCPGHTLFLGDEQLYVTARTGVNVTAMRGVNGTTPTAHTAAPVYFAVYPADVTRACLWLAAEAWRLMGSAGLTSQRIGQYSEAFGALDHRMKATLLRRYWRPKR